MSHKLVEFQQLLRCVFREERRRNLSLHGQLLDYKPIPSKFLSKNIWPVTRHRGLRFLKSPLDDPSPERTYQGLVKVCHYSISRLRYSARFA